MSGTTRTDIKDPGTPASGLWTAHQVADYIKCSVSYVYKAAERDLLPAVRIGRMLRFRPEAVQSFVGSSGG